MVGDLHFSSLWNRHDFETSLIPTKPFLLTTGDIVQPYSNMCYNFYSYCARNWEKTYIIMGNQEYECHQRVFHQTMEKQLELMVQLINRINREVGSERLVFIHNTFVDLPEQSLRIAGLTLWSNKADINVLRKNVLTEGEVFTEFAINGRGFNIATDSGRFGGWRPIKSWDPVDQVDVPVSYATLTNDDLVELQKNDIEFLHRMIRETSEKGYRLLVGSHYVPTCLIKKESPIIPAENEFPIDFFCRDVSNYLKPPIVAWVCGHVHLEQTVIVNGIPVYVNMPTITV